MDFKELAMSEGIPETEATQLELTYIDAINAGIPVTANQIIHSYISVISAQFVSRTDWGDVAQKMAKSFGLIETVEKSETEINGQFWRGVYKKYRA